MLLSYLDLGESNGEGAILELASIIDNDICVPSNYTCDPKANCPLMPSPLSVKAIFLLTQVGYADPKLKNEMEISDEKRQRT
jgi:hypothetical protein